MKFSIWYRDTYRCTPCQSVSLIFCALWLLWVSIIKEKPFFHLHKLWEDVGFIIIPTILLFQTLQRCCKFIFSVFRFSTSKTPTANLHAYSSLLFVQQTADLCTAYNKTGRQTCQAVFFYMREWLHKSCLTRIPSARDEINAF